MNLKAIWEILKETFSEWSEDNASRLAAALAYYTVFSIAPLLIIVIVVVGAVFGQSAVEGQIVTQIEGTVGENAAQLIETMLKNISERGSGLWATVIAIVTVLVGATGVFNQLQDALNTIWEVAPKPGRGLKGMIQDRLISFLMILGIGLLLIATFILSASLAAIEGFLGDLVPDFFNLLQFGNAAISFGLTVLLFGMIYKVLPDVEISWRDVWVGATATAVLFTVGRYLIGLYLTRSSVSSAYGAAGSLVIILVWVYYSTQVILLGAEFTQVYARKRGSRILPAKNAVRVVRKTRPYTEAANQAGEETPQPHQEH